MTETAPQTDRQADRPAVVAPATRDAFLELLRRSEIAEPAALDRWLDGNPGAGGDSAAGLAEALVQARLLTDWQREKLLEGRWKGFFLGKYKILDRLGAGAMGRVYLAEHRVMRRRVALKVLAKRLSGREAYVQRFQQEARAAAAVNSPRIVKAFDIDCEEDMHFLVMEYVDGVDLQQLVSRQGPLPVRQAADLVLQIADGLEAVHRAGLIHRDIKPANVLLDRAGQIHVLDLGLARLTDSDEPSLTLVHDTKLIGTVDYLAPEQARNSHDIDHRADLYSLGGTMYFLLTGRPPFNEGTLPQRVALHLTQPPPEIRQLRGDVPDEIARICHRMLEKEPARRYQRGAEIVADLAAFLGVASRPSGTTVQPVGRPPSAEGDELLLAELDPAADSRVGPASSAGGPARAIAARGGSTASPSAGGASTQSSASGPQSAQPGGGSLATPRRGSRRNQPARRGTGSDVLSPSQLARGKSSNQELAASPSNALPAGGDTLIGGDSLAGLLEELLPSALDPSPRPAPGESAIPRAAGLRTGAANQNEVAVGQSRSGSSATAAQCSAPVRSPVSAAPQSLNAYEVLLRQVTTGAGDMGGFTYRTWFLVLFGLAVGGIVGLVILQLFASGARSPYKGGFEDRSLILPSGAASRAPPAPPATIPAGPAANPPPPPPAPPATLSGAGAAPAAAPAIPRPGRRED